MKQSFLYTVEAGEDKSLTLELSGIQIYIFKVKFGSFYGNFAPIFLIKKRERGKLSTVKQGSGWI